MKFVRAALVGAIAILLVICGPHLVGDPSGLGRAIANEIAPDVPANGGPRPAILLETKNSGQVGDLVYASVRLDGLILFDVAAARTFADEDEQKGPSPLDVRIQRIENRLHTFLRERLNGAQDLETLQVEVSEVNGQLVVRGMNAVTVNPVAFVTVTDNDTEIYGLTAAEVGNYYAERISQGLTRAYEERQAAYVRTIAARIVGMAIVTGLLTFLSYRLGRHNWRQQRQHQEQLRQLISSAPMPPNGATPAEPITPAGNTSASKRVLKQQLNRLRIQFQGLVLIQVLLWLVTISLSLRMFPQTRLLGLLLFNRPIQIGLTWFVIILVRQINLFIADRLLLFFLHNYESESIAKQERLRKRLPTLVDTIKGLVQTLLLLLGAVLTVIFLFGLSRFGVFASAGVVGLGASIVFQSSLQDAIAGAMLLWHDAYAVGDIIGIEASTGQVEKMTLLMTQIRTSDGELVSFRNGTIDHVKNHTKEWARIDLTVDVALTTDTDKALHLMGQVFESMITDPQWRSVILSEPDILAIERLAHSGVTLKIRAKTAPIHQWNVSREYRRRLKQAFESAGIEMGIPQQHIRLQNSAEDTTGSLL